MRRPRFQHESLASSSRRTHNFLPPSPSHLTMPPRRSSRKPSSEPPEPVARKVSSSKRKRNEIPEDVPEQDSEVVSEAEAPSKGRRGGSRAPAGGSTSKGKGRAAVKASTPEENSVVESDAASPPKRPRTNAKGKQKAAAKEQEPTDESEDEFLSAAEEVEDDEDEQPVRPPRRGSRAPSKPPSSKSKSKAAPRGSKGKKIKEEVALEIVDEEDAEEDALQPPKSSSSKGKARKADLKSNPPSRASVATLASEHEESQDEGTPAPSDFFGDLPTPRAKRVSMSSQAMQTPTKSAKKALVVEEESEVEEHSLLDPPDLPSPRRPRLSAIPPPPVIEEPQGPKSRLVIHKMVLVNFKSYAGRQIIGPFHKVS